MRRAGLAVYVHLVWGTWDRHPVLIGETKRIVYRAIGAKCHELDVELVALGGIEDHVHLLIRLPATLPIAHIVKHIKGASSHLATHATTPPAEFFKWQGAYGAVSVSPRHLPAICAYIAHQAEHHAAGTLNPEWEDAGAPTPTTPDVPTPTTPSAPASTLAPTPPTLAPTGMPTSPTARAHSPGG